VLAAALSQHLGDAGEADVVVDVVMGLAADFADEAGVDIRADGAALHRMAEGYLKAQGEISQSGKAEINLPFLTANETGPKHYSRVVTVADIQAAAMRTQAPPAPAPAAAPLPEPRLEKKRWWWPF